MSSSFDRAHFYFVLNEDAGITALMAQESREINIISMR